MKKETLLARIRDRTEPPLDIQHPPEGCTVWLGASKGGMNARPVRRFGYITRSVDLPRGVIKYQGKQHYVHRLIHWLLYDSTDRLRQLCGTPLCINPNHWKTPERVAPEPEFILNDDWTPEEVEELLEIVLTESEPQSFADVMTHPILEDAPAQLVQEALTKLNKDHLT